MRVALRIGACALPILLGSRAANVSVASDGELLPPPAVLSPSEFRTFRVSRVAALTPDTKRITISFPREGDTSGASTASCIVIKANVGGKDVVRPYTPVSPASQRGTMDLIVKAYPAGAVSKCVFPPPWRAQQPSRPSCVAAAQPAPPCLPALSLPRPLSLARASRSRTTLPTPLSPEYPHQGPGAA